MKLKSWFKREPSENTPDTTTTPDTITYPDNFGDLVNEFTTLPLDSEGRQGYVDEILRRGNEYQGLYTDLNSDFDELLEDYNGLLSDYNNLQESFKESVPVNAEPEEPVDREELSEPPIDPDDNLGTVPREYLDILLDIAKKKKEGK